MSPTLDFSRFFETYKSSVFNNDVESLMALFGKDLVAFDIWGVGPT
jgi:hypothetical protein